jgi:DNA-binding transcriptional LysR family regulator
MELRHLRYFLAVGEALKFTRAAAQLRVAQPALGRPVQDLEDGIGVDLVSTCRTKHPFEKEPRLH